MSDTLDPHEEGGTPEPTETAAPEFKITEDRNQITYGTDKYHRAEALIEARKEAQQLREQVNQIAPFMPEFTEFLENKRNSRGASAHAAAPSGDDYSEQDLEGVASIRGYYKDDGVTLNLDRARQDMDLMTRIARGQATRAVEPVARTSAAERAARNRQEAMSRNYVDGNPIASAESLQQAFDALPPELAADPNVANLVQLLAMGMDAAADRRSGKAGTRREPQFTEGGTGRLDAGNSRGLSQFSVRAAQARGKTIEQWQKLVNQTTKQSGRDTASGYELEDGL